MGRQFHQTFPSSTRPLLVWQWRGSLENAHVEESLKRFSKLGFGGVILAPRGENALLNFPSPAWLEILSDVRTHARRLKMELWVEIPLADPSGAGVFKDMPAGLFISQDKMEPFTGPGLDLLSSGAASKFIGKILSRHEPFSKQEQGPRGIVLGHPEWPAGCEPWNDELAAALRDEGFAQPADRLPELFDPAAGDSDRSFSYIFRRAVARKIRDEFAGILVEWAKERGMLVCGPAERVGDAFPSWTFSAAGAIRTIDIQSGGQSPEQLQWALGCWTASGTGVTVSLPWEGPEAVGAESIRHTLEPLLINHGARAALNWAPWNESGLELDDPFAPLPCALPDLKGLDSLNLRLTSWTVIGRSSVPHARIVAVHPRTSQWRLPNGGADAAPNGALADTGDNEGLRLKNLWSNLGGCLREAGFGCDSWDERRVGEMPNGHSGKLDFGDSEYEIAILPGLLNLTKDTWICLADFAAGGGKVLALERYPAFVDGVVSDELSDWARRYVERFKTTTSLIAWLKERIERPVKAQGGASRSDSSIAETTIFDADDERQWIVARNPNRGVSSRCVVEIDSGIGDSIEDVCLETGSVSSPSSLTRTESVARLKLELAPGETRLLRRRKSQSAAPKARDLVSEENLGVDWRVRRIEDNLFPLSEFEYSLHGVPWTGPDPLVDLHQALLRQAPQWSGGPQSDIRLRARFSFGQMPLIGAREMMNLGLLVSSKAPIRNVSMNGEEVDVDSAAPAGSFGLTRIPLTIEPNEGENVLEIHIEYAEAQELRSVLSGPWILTGRFGVVPDGAGNTNRSWRLEPMPGDKEWLAHFVNREMSLVGGIRKLENRRRMTPFEPPNPAWADWPEWPLLHGRKTMREIGFPFYGGMVELEKTFFAPDPKSQRTRWRSAVFQLGMSRTAWAEAEINGHVAGGLSMSPFQCETGALLKPGERNDILVRAWMPWFNALAPFQRCLQGAAGHSEIIPFCFCRTPRILFFN